MIVECKTCGHKFDNNGDSKRKYCSNFCAHDGKKYVSRALSQIKSQTIKNKSADYLKCVICGKKMKTGHHGKTKKYCSDSCMHKSRKEYMAAYYKEKYENDPGFRNRRPQYNKANRTSLAANRRIKDLQILSLILTNKSTEDILELLDKNVSVITMSGDFYEKYKK